MEIINCGEEYSSQILEILNDAILNSTALYDYKPRTIESMANWFQAKFKNRYPVIGIVDNQGVLLAFGSYGSFRSWAAYKYTIEHSIYVAKNQRGKGLGKVILGELIKCAEVQNYHCMIAGIDANNTASIKLHQAFGFEFCGTIRQVGYKFNKWLNLDFYQLLLKTPDVPDESESVNEAIGSGDFMSIIDLFSERSDLYAAARPQYPKELYEFLASCCASRDRAWDCGTGSGQAAINLAQYFSEVHATDASEQQIANAIQKENVLYSVQPAESTRFPDHYFDLVIVAQALHWFDFDRFWSEVKRLLKRDGIFAAWGYDWFSVSPEIDAVIKERILDVIAPYWSPRVRHLWSGYQDVGFPFEPIQVPPMTMKVLWNLPELLAYLHTWSATKQCIQQQGIDFFEALNEALLDVWDESEAKKEITMNFHVVAGRN